MKHYFEKISGWFNFEQIYDEAVRIAQDGDVFVETGTWFGKSTCYLGVEAINSGKNINIVTIDIDRQYQEYAEFPGATISRSEKILENIKPLKNVKYINGDSLQECTNFADESLRMVFLDADHSYEFVIKEMEAWYPKVMRGGLFAGHDADWAGVMQAINEFTKRHGLTYEIVNSSWLIRK